MNTEFKEVVHFFIHMIALFLALVLWFPTLGQSFRWLEELDIRLTLWER